MERLRRQPGDNQVNSTPHAAISNLMTHVDLWHTRDEEWIYIFEEDVELNSQFASVGPSETQCLLDEAERFAATHGNHSLMYLGSGGEHWDGSGTRVLCPSDGACQFAVAPCAPLTTHSYAVSRREARTLWERIQYVVKPFADTGYPMFRYTIDAEIRAYYVRARKWGKHEMMRPAAQEWPLCLMPRSHGLFGQRKQYAEENSRYHSHSHSGHVLW